ncbi:MAG: protein kinase [Lentisphaeria bacterium]|nr:protein kinase [Lentisphaeria bacterium]NQZ70411.1 protein kinase [Lentisphaeria bacterium]
MSNLVTAEKVNDTRPVTKKKVLLVDDESAVRMLLREVLSDCNLDIIEAENAEDALEIVNAQKVDLIVSDLMMPGKTGVDLLNEINELHPSTPVLIITGKPTVEAAVDCMKGGAVDFLTKPFDILQFKDMVEKALTTKTGDEDEVVALFHELKMLGDYKIKKVLGEGTSGIVFLAIKNDAEYALKLFKFANLADSRQEELKSRFMREADFLSQISHPNIVQLHEFGFSGDGIPYIVMEYVKGSTLKRFIGSSLSYNRKIEIILKVASAIQDIHGHGIIHRDVKPDNVMIDDDMTVKLTDFGIIRLPDSELTLIANIMGSPAYLAPEGFVSANVTNKSDVFSLGIMTYELILGRRPFLADDLFTMANMVQNEYPPEPKKLDSGIPDRLQLIIARMIKKSPQKRYCTDDLILDLDNFLDPSKIRSDYEYDDTGIDWD